ncbi:hypothetical protein ACFPM0_20630 [Pseudonocardia sulfidoxydans]|uniref:hypothetical protein n=1 Tax=Pseudonocardia sulfidoxydans TaxID=54011 RepID=UPI0036106284
MLSGDRDRRTGLAQRFRGPAVRGVRNGPSATLRALPRIANSIEGIECRRAFGPAW